MSGGQLSFESKEMKEDKIDGVPEKYRAIYERYQHIPFLADFLRNCHLPPLEERKNVKGMALEETQPLIDEAEKIRRETSWKQLQPERELKEGDLPSSGETPSDHTINESHRNKCKEKLTEIKNILDHAIEKGDMRGYHHFLEVCRHVQSLSPIPAEYILSINRSYLIKAVELGCYNQFATLMQANYVFNEENLKPGWVETLLEMAQYYRILSAVKESDNQKRELIIEIGCNCVISAVELCGKQYRTETLSENKIKLGEILYQFVLPLSQDLTDGEKKKFRFARFVESLKQFQREFPKQFTELRDRYGDSEHPLVKELYATAESEKKLIPSLFPKVGEGQSSASPDVSVSSTQTYTLC
jgi:hypothetical protein